MYKEKKNVISSKIVSLIMSVIVLVSALPIGVLADNYLLYDDIPSSRVSSNTNYKAGTSGTQFAMFVFKKNLNITNTPSGHSPQANYPDRLPYDIVSGISSDTNAYAPFDCTVTHKLNEAAHPIIIESDNNVIFADGTIGKMTIMVLHDNNVDDINVGDKFKQGEKFYQMGTAADPSVNITGAHVHIEIARGSFKNVSNSNIKKEIRNKSNAIHLYDALFLYDGTNIISKKGIESNFKMVSDYDENIRAFNSSISTSVAGYYYLTTSNAPVRRSPSDSAETVETLSKGDIIYVSASGKNTANNTWYRTTNGYIYPYTDNGSSRLAKITSPYIFELSDVKNHNSSLSSSDYVCSVVKANTGYSLSNSTSFGCIIYVKSNNTYTEVARATDNKTISHDFMYYNISQNPTASNTKFLTSSGTQYKFTSGNVYFYRFFMTYNNKSNYSYSYNYANDTPYFKFVSSGTHTHSYGGWVYYDEAQHKATCTSCDAVKYQNHTWDSGTVTKAATHTSTGVKTYTCTACGATKTETIAKTTTHSFGAWTKLNDTQHQRTCACGEKQTENHTWDSGTVTKPASYTETGVRTYTCTVCNATKTETIAKLDKPVDPNSLQFVIGNANAKPGETIKVNITLKNNPGISSFKFHLFFDNGLILIDAKYGDLFTADNMYINTESYPAMFNWIRFGSNASDDGTFVTLTFMVADNVKYGEKLRIYAVCEQNNIFNTDFEEIAFEATDGFVTVSNHILGDINGDGTADNKDVVTLFNYVSGANVYVVEGSTDVNGDGLTNNKDIVVLFKYVSGVNITIY
jgi:hypothetical protein